MSEESERNATYLEAIQKALDQNRFAVPPDTAVEIAEIVLMAAADYLERTAPYAKLTVKTLRAAADSVGLEIEE